MSTKLIAITLATLALSATAALAHPKYDPDARAADEAARIEAGRQSGSITYFEGRALRKEQQAISEREAQLRAQNEGELRKRDRRELKELQDKADQDITTLASNGHRRWSILPRVGR
jgi:hypothetical protein